MGQKSYTSVEVDPPVEKDTKSLKSGMEKFEEKCCNAKMRKIQKRTQKMRKPLFPGFGLEK